MPPMEVVVQDSFEGALKELKRKVSRDGIHLEIRRREESPNLTDRKKEKARLALRRRLKNDRKKEFREQRYGRA